MIQPERREELEAIAYEIFNALSTERYEPSERGAGWAPTDKGYEDVISILHRAGARMYKDSPAERRKEAIARRLITAKRAALKLRGIDKIITSVCIHCNLRIFREKGRTLWSCSDNNDECLSRKNLGHRFWNHEPIEVME